MYPKVARCSVSSTEYVTEIDRDTYAWPTLSLWDKGVSPAQWFEWGVFPAREGVRDAQTRTDGAFGSICFRFDARNGRLYGLEIPSNLVKQSLQNVDVDISNIKEEGPFDVFSDVDFWQETSCPRQKAIIAPVRSSASRNELRIDFMNGPLLWLPLSNTIWLARNSEQLIAGIRCMDSSIDIGQFASET